MFHPRGPTLLELARQALSSTTRGYDLLAPKFEYTPFRTPDAVLDAVARSLEPVDDALDVCCGTGAACRMLRTVARKRVLGVDLSAGMMEEARRLWDEQPEGPPRLELVQADALDLPFRSEFDLAVSFGAFGHIEPLDEPAFVRSVHRALRPGGRFVFVTSAMPAATSWKYWAARGFNGVMRVRNALLSPPFVMYYLTFLWPDVRTLLEDAGFEVQAREGCFDAPYESALLVTATRPA